MQVLSQTRAKLIQDKQGENLFDKYALRDEDKELMRIFLRDTVHSIAAINTEVSQGDLTEDGVVFSINDGSLKEAQKKVLCGKLQSMILYGSLKMYYSNHNMQADAEAMNTYYKDAKTDYQKMLFDSQFEGC